MESSLASEPVLSQKGKAAAQFKRVVKAIEVYRGKPLAAEEVARRFIRILESLQSKLKSAQDPARMSSEEAKRIGILTDFRASIERDQLIFTGVGSRSTVGLNRNVSSVAADSIKKVAKVSGRTQAGIANILWAIWVESCLDVLDSPFNFFVYSNQLTADNVRSAGKTFCPGVVPAVSGDRIVAGEVYDPYLQRAGLVEGSELIAFNGRKLEADRYKDVFKGAGNQCVNTKEARETLIKASGSLLFNPILDAMRVFKPGEEEWDLAVRKISGLGSRYRDLAPPQSVSGSVEKKGDRIEIQAVAKDWLIYYMAKALWRYEPGFRQRFGGASDDKATLAEENFAFASLAGARLNARESKDKPAEANPYLDSITEIYGANANIGFLLMEVLHKTYGVSLQCLSPNLLDALRSYHSAFALEPIKSAAD